MIQLFFWVFLSFFLKDLYMSKNGPKKVVSKNKANYRLMFLVHIGKNYQEIIKISITKAFI